MRKWMIYLFLPLLLFAQTRTFSPTLRSSLPSPLTASQVDANFLGLANVANTAAKVTFAASQGAMLATAPPPQQGDICWRTDLSAPFYFLGGDPTNIANWSTNGASVTSLFGRTGAITAQSGDYTVSQVTGALSSAALASTSSGQGAELIGYLAPYTGAVATTQREHNSRAVSILDFLSTAQKIDVMARTVGLDCRAAVQAAVTYCIANGFDLEVPGLVRLDSSVNVDRPTNGSTPYSTYFNIRSVNGGGFYTGNAINMFGSTLGVQGSQLLRFIDCTFLSPGVAASYVFDATKIIRVGLEGCSFVGMRVFTAAALVQSVYLNRCQSRFTSGVTIDAQSSAYDLHVDQCIFENGAADYIHLQNAVGCSVTNSIMEGGVIAIAYQTVQGMLISGNYFEGNTGADIYGRLTGAGGYARGLAIHGNFFDPGLTGRVTPCIIWPDVAVGCSSLGNDSNGAMHQFLTSTCDVLVHDYCGGALFTGTPNPSLSSLSLNNLQTGFIQHSYQMLNNGAATSYTFPANTEYAGIVTSVTTGGTLTINFPAAASTKDGTVMMFMLSCAGTPTLVLASTGATFVAAPATATANTVYRFIYSASGTQWWPY
jgi:hypothetical protein